MIARKTWSRFGMLAATALLVSCDPGVHLAWKKEFAQRIDRRCIEIAVKSVTGNASLSTYESEGRIFPEGLTVYQIRYETPFNEKLFRATSGYRIEVAPMPGGSTGYYHQWGKLGTDIGPQERDYVIPIMAKVNAAVARQCGVSVGNGKPIQGAG